MTLMYRGVAYTQAAPANVSSAAMVTGKYRGAEMSIPHPASAPIRRYHFNLKYRGVPYQANTRGDMPNNLASAF